MRCVATRKWRNANTHYCVATLEMLQCTKMGMSSAKFLKRQAAACADMAAQTEDEASRERCLRLERTYLELAEAEEKVVVPVKGFAEGERSDI
jgi:triphosphoribosyl-dephospho-CoA synthetase